MGYQTGWLHRSDPIRSVLNMELLQFYYSELVPFQHRLTTERSSQQNSRLDADFLKPSRSEGRSELGDRPETPL